MPVYALTNELIFPPPDHADPNGLLAVGGDLSPKRLILAYSRGIFPWYEDGFPILWHSPDPRFVLEVDKLRIPRSLKKRARQQPYRLTLDTAFRQVIASCAHKRRPGQRGTWITREMADAYGVLHDLGFAHSVEAWLGDELVGGLYGVSLGRIYFGESMFAHAPDASKIAFVALVRQLARWDVPLVDSQVYTDHLARFGAEDWRRADYLAALEKALRWPTRRGAWSFDPDILDAL